MIICSEVYLEACQTSRQSFLTKIANGFLFLTILVKMLYRRFELHKKWNFPLRISSVKYFFSFLWISSHLLKKSLTENFIFCEVLWQGPKYILHLSANTFNYNLVHNILEFYKVLVRVSVTTSKRELCI